MAKVSKAAIEKRLLSNSNDKEVTKEQVTEAMIKTWKKQVKKEKILEECRMHEYFLPKKIRRIKKAEMHKFD